MKIEKVLCIGAGFVGGPTMAVMAEQCPEIRFTVVDINPQRIAGWNSDILPIFEPGLADIVKRTRGRNLFFQEPSEKFIAEADMIFISVNTPTKTSGEGAGWAADLQFVENCAREILAHAKNNTVVVEKSTVPVRTAETISRILHSASIGRKFEVLSNPEFLAEGTAIENLKKPDRVLIGHNPTPQGKAAAKTLLAIYRQWVPRKKILLPGVWSSELSKLAANAVLAQRISSINAISAICEKTGADVKEISRAIGMDPRIGEKFLEAGVGFGGSCFKKDILELSYLSNQFGLKEVADYWYAILEINEYQTVRFARMIIENQPDGVTGKRVAIFGFAFKPGTNDSRESPARGICQELLKAGAHLVVSDPKALENARKDLKVFGGKVEFEQDPYKAAEGACAVALVTHWPEYTSLDYSRIYNSMTKPAYFFDGRVLIDPQSLRDIGFQVYGLGRPSPSPADLEFPWPESNASK